MNTEFVCTAEFTAKSNMIEKLIAELSKLIPLARKEPGCLRYEMHRCLENPDVVFFIERYKNKAAFDFHCATDYVKNIVDEQIPALVEKAEFRIYSEI
ncbi:MAG: antibiotic biosynthesis monooxygenase [Gammaproteobacteria bacterium]|nr:antibiotic biosynthesis monooxygenase [Gammaproteobacteria bacterium]MBY0545500.1 antibiotic biosynthesis monooxygenase [Gammaproteobacteria bacterium]